MEVKTYKDLIIWQKSMDLSFLIYELVKQLPQEETYGLSNQMRRAVVSIPSNIAEGHQRGSSKEYLHFLYIAKGSLGELETQVLICKGLQYLSNEQIDTAIMLCEEIGKMITSTIKSITKRM